MTHSPNPYSIPYSITNQHTTKQGYEEGEEAVASALSCGYPRFVYHPYLLTLMDHAIDVYCKKEGNEKVGDHVSRLQRKRVERERVERERVERERVERERTCCET